MINLSGQKAVLGLFAYSGTRVKSPIRVPNTHSGPDWLPPARSLLRTTLTESRRTCKQEAHVPFKKPFCRKIAKRNRFDTGFCPKLPRSGVIRRPPLAGAPWLRISDTVCLSAVIGPVLLSVKMCFWPYEIVFKSPRRPNFDREGRCNKRPGNEPEKKLKFQASVPKVR